MDSVVRLEQNECELMIRFCFPAVSVHWLSIGCQDEVSIGKQRLRLSLLPNDSLCTVGTVLSPDMGSCNDLDNVDCALSEISLHCKRVVNWT